MSYKIDFTKHLGPLFRLVSPLEFVQRRDMKTKEDTGSGETHTTVNPMDTYPLEGGEWLQLDPALPETVLRPVLGAATVFDPAAGTESTAATDCAYARTYMTLMEKGSTDLQPLKKAPLAWIHGFEAETLLFKAGSIAIDGNLVVGRVTHPHGSYKVAGLIAQASLGGAGSS